ncbi:MAG: hypothetical protein BGO32_02000 [Bacteroidetes bacterium 37-13]|nr:MAG: hypothetical protein BGO32_02000 [Bacteroidetes bacterium 37-13]
MLNENLREMLQHSSTECLIKKAEKLSVKRKKKNSTVFFENQMQKITFAPRFLKTSVAKCVLKHKKLH